MYTNPFMSPHTHTCIHNHSPAREAALLGLALNASVYWGIEALWGIFDPVSMPLAGMYVHTYVYVM